MKFSMMTYTMARQGCSVEEIVKCATDLKMDGIDWVTGYGRKASELKKMSADAGLPIVCYTFFAGKLVNNEPGGVDEVKASIDFALELGAPVIMIPTPAVGGCSTRIECQNRWIKALASVETLFAEAKLVFTVENFPGDMSPLITAADFFAMKKVIPSLKLTFDNGNAGSGENPVESYLKCKDDVVHAHFKDWDISDTPKEGYRKMLDGRYYCPALIGEGGIDNAGTLKAMRSAGYKGYINIEYENNKYPAAEATKRVLEYLRSI